MNHSFSKQELEGLYYFTMPELKKLCKLLKLSDKGIKTVLIDRIVLFLTTGKIAKEQELPAISCARRGVNYPLAPTTLMLHGSFKNDLQTRQFLKTLIGEHFHYTAAGIDWLKECWYAGNPPTYAEYAAFWQEQYLNKAKPGQSKLKKEWALLNFMRRYLTEHPEASQKTVMSEWKKIREQEYTETMQLILSKI